MDVVYIVIACIGAFLELFLVFRLFFSCSADYFEAWKYVLTPDLISAFRGEFTDDFFATLKLNFYHATGLLTGIGIYTFLDSFFG